MSDVIKRKGTKVKTLDACQNKVAKNVILAIDQEVKLSLAKNVSSAIGNAGPGAYCSRSGAINLPTRKMSYTQMISFEKLNDEQNSQKQLILNQTDTDAKLEIPLDDTVDQDLQDRMAESIKAIEKEDETKSKKLKLWIFSFLMLLLVSIVIGIIVPILIRKRNSSNREKIDITANIEECQGSLDDNLTTKYQVLRNNISNEFSDKTPIIDTPYSAVRNSLCWLANIDGPQLKNIESQTYKLIQNFVLGVIYYSFLGVENDFTSNKLKDFYWMSDLSECKWNYVNCNENDEIIALVFSDLDLEGSLPSEISFLTHLKTFRLYDTPLEGNIPQEIGEMSQLQSLEISGSSLTGSIPDNISNLLNLKVLEFGSTDLSGTVPSINKLTQLTDLHVSRNYFLDIPFDAFSSCTNLEMLHITNTESSYYLPSFLTSFPKLKKLELHVGDLSGTIPSEVGFLTELTELQIQYLSQEDSTIPTELGNLSKLKFIRLLGAYRGTIPSEFGNLQNLSHLYLESPNLSDRISSELVRLTKLEALTLFTTSGIHKFSKPEEIRSFLLGR